MNNLPNIACADNGSRQPTSDVQQDLLNSELFEALKNELKLEIKSEVRAEVEKEFQAKENCWAKEKEKMTKQINDLREELIELKTGKKTAVLEIRDNWRSHEDENWLLPHITEFYNEMKEKHKKDKEVLKELDKMYEEATSKRKRRICGSAALAGGALGLGAGVGACIMSAKVAAASGFLATAGACCPPLAIAAIAGLGVFALVAGGCWIYIGLKKRKVGKEEQEKE